MSVDGTAMQLSTERTNVFASCGLGDMLSWISSLHGMYDLVQVSLAAGCGSCAWTRFAMWGRIVHSAATMSNLSTSGFATCCATLDKPATPIVVGIFRGQAVVLGLVRRPQLNLRILLKP